MTAIRRVLIAGAGKMGQEIAYQCAAHGYQVILYDISQPSLDGALQEISGLANTLYQSNPLGTLVMKKKMITPAMKLFDAIRLARRQREIVSPKRLSRALALIEISSDPACARDADLVIESIPEDPDLKGRLFSEFDRFCPAHAIFATNTSTLLPSMFAEQSGRPHRLAALHFHPPIWDSQIVDVMPHAGTDPAVITTLEDFTWSISQIPVTMTVESSGYIFNSMLSAFLGAASTLAANGIASIEDIDRSWMAISKMPVGPFGIMDGIGLQTEVLGRTDRQSAEREESHLPAALYRPGLAGC